MWPQPNWLGAQELGGQEGPSTPSSEGAPPRDALISDSWTPELREKGFLLF